MEENYSLNKTMTQMGIYSNATDELEDENSLRSFDLIKKDKNRENIICVELINNNKIHIKFDDDWTIEKLIKSIILHKEFEKIYTNFYWKLDSYELNSLFDMHLILFRNIKDDLETKVDHNLKLIDLKNKKLLPSSNHPFFIFKDNRNKSYLSYNLDDYNDILKEYNDENFLNLYRLYKHYLPRTNTLSSLRYSPVDDIFEEGQNRVNSLNKLNLDELISDKDGEDWFTYDDESLNFLMKNENMNYEVDIYNNIYSPEEEKIYFQDKLPYTVLSSKEYKKVFLRIVLKEFDTVLSVNLKTKAIEVLVKINEKMKNMKKLDEMFIPEEKVLKVRSMNDYIIDIDEELGRFNYITQCIKNSDIPEYIIVDHPGKVIKERHNSLGQTKNLDLVDLSKNKLYNESKRGLFDEISISREKASDISNTIVTRPKNKSNYRKHLMVNKQNVNKIFNIAKHIPDENNLKKSNSNFQSNGLKFKKGVNNNPLSFSKGSSANSIHQFQDVGGLIEKTSFQLDEFLVVDCKKQLELLEKEEEERKLLIQNTIRNRASVVINPIELEGHSNQNIMNCSMIGGIAPKNKTTLNFKVPNFKKTNSNHIDYSQQTDSNSNTSINKVDEFLKFCHSDIELSSLKRPFSIKFREFRLNHTLNSTIEQQENLTVIAMKCIIMCGKDKFSNKRSIIWRGYGKNLISALINKRIYFETKYCDLPIILFKIKLLKYNSFNKLIGKDLICYANFRLFDHLKRLKTGVHKINMWENSKNPFSDDSYFKWTENFSDDSTHIYFELESFMRPVRFNFISKQSKMSCTHSFTLDIKDQVKIYEILERSPFQEINSYDKRTIWSNRYALTQIESAIPFIFSCVDYKKQDNVKEIDKIISLCKPLPPLKAIQFLSGKFLHESIRKYAVTCLQNAKIFETEDYLIQLVQALKYEMYHDSHLANYLLTIAINHPLTVGHIFFWNLKSEVYHPDYQQRFGLYLSVFLNKIGYLRKVFEQEVWLMKKLLDICDIPFDKTIKDKSDVIVRYREELKKISDSLSSPISMPLNFKYRVKGIKENECRIMKSKKKPIWLVFQNEDEKGNDIKVMFKKGDDLRQDILTLQLFKVMQNLWFDNGLHLKMSLYSVISTGFFQGMLHIVEQSETLATIHKIYGGATVPLFSNKPLREWLEKTSAVPKSDWELNFLLSCSAYCVATFVLGIGDRHNDNIMIKKNGELFHIDFGHFLGHFKYKYGIKRERAPFVFTDEFLNVLGGNGSQNHNQFISYIKEAYQILRKNADVLISLLRMMLCTGIPELTESSIKSLDTSLSLNTNSKQAQKFLLEKLKEALDSWSTKLNFAIHVIANK